jgi:hypothetical protein
MSSPISKEMKRVIAQRKIINAKKISPITNRPPNGGTTSNRYNINWLQGPMRITCKVYR